MTENERIAVKLFGWERLDPPIEMAGAKYHWRYSHNIHDFEVPDYAADWNAAALVVRALEERGWYVETLRRMVQVPEGSFVWECLLTTLGGKQRFSVSRPTLPEVIVAAAVAALDRDALLDATQPPAPEPIAAAPPARVYCERCGDSVPLGAAYCGECGRLD